MTNTPLFTRILIANRGEIACRVIRTCRRLGIATVAVYSEADRDARHVRLADEAICIGPAPARESYLRGDAILDAARRTGAQAIHPGYGFLSENSGFARACAEAGIVFIGPPPAAIDAMGDKSAAKALMQQAGVPLTPGYHGQDQSPLHLQQQADAIGYPVLIKASAGGGGKGMRRVDDAAAFVDALASCQREARSAFGNDHVLVEKYIERPRHIEIQVFADTHGNVVHLFERDCSVQRRHQKVLEEAPAPGMDPARRAAMGTAAVEAARAVGYVGAGTVEFIASQDGQFWFMEMNTRLQVEHPVTELVTGTDLVEWQLRVAAGQVLPLRQQDLALHGHAIEARLYAEDADRGFLPSTGTLRHLRLPAAGPHVRVDAGVDAGDTISAFYDPMIAKLIVHGPDRASALQAMAAALAEVEVVGVTTNAAFLRRLVCTASFQQAHLDTALIEREQEALALPANASTDADWAIAAVALLGAATSAPAAGIPDAGIPAAALPPSPWAATDGWRLSGHAPRRIGVALAGEQRELLLTSAGAGWQVRDAGTPEVSLLVRVHMEDGTLHAEVDGRQRRLRAFRDGTALVVFKEGRSRRFVVHDRVAEAGSADADAGGILAPMPGRIIATPVADGTRVSRGTPLLVMEAMKMEHTLQAPADGVLTRYRVREGDQVQEGMALVEFEAE